MKNNKLLIVVDESPATTKVLQYVARMAAGRANFRICLVHSLGSPPTQLVEFRGTDKERVRSYKSRWNAKEATTEQRTLDDANAILHRSGITKARIEAHFCYLVDGIRASQEILKLARARKCDTVVIGRKSLSWLKELIDGDPAEELVRRGKGLTIWVVE
jgi:nucleotide-binding universal stress UspA family protein